MNHDINGTGPYVPIIVSRVCLCGCGHVVGPNTGGIPRLVIVNRKPLGWFYPGCGREGTVDGVQMKMELEEMEVGYGNN